ncbi:MAG TPA: LapA family protein [Psychromonas sp.]
MRHLVRFLFALVLLSALLFGFLFNYENPTPVTVVLLGVNLPELRLGFWLLVALLTGAVIGFVISLFSALLQKRAITQLKHQKAALEKENQVLRSQALRD